MDFAPYIATLPALMLVIARLGGMLVFAPVLGESVVPVRLRALVAVVLALGVAGQVAAPARLPQSDLAWVLALAGEFLIGLAIGYAGRLGFVGVELGAFHVSQQMGLSLGEVFSPSSDETSDAMRQFFRMLALVIFLAIGGHRMLIGSLLASFQSVPLTAFLAPAALAAMLAGLLTVSFTLALKVAAPVLLAMLLAALALGFVQRAMPQFNFLSTGAPVRVVLGLVVIAFVLSLPVLVDLLGWATSAVGSGLRTCMEARP